jgi:hypothetical protein
MTPSYSPASASALRAPLVGTAVIVFLTAAFLTLQFTSLRPGFVERDIATAGRRLSDLVSEGEGYFEEISALTAQLPSRTAIRDALARSLAGQETPEAVTAFTTPRIGDAVEASALLLGVVRIDREETIVARYGTVLPDDAASRAAIAAGNAATVLPGYFEIGDHRTIQIVQPIVHGTGELLGWTLSPSRRRPFSG